VTEAAPRHAVDRLRLGRFRSYALAEIAPGAASVALSGPNGAGKTNLLEAVSMLVPGRGLRRAPMDAFAQHPDPAGWRLRAGVSAPSGRVEIVTGAEPGATRRMVAIDGRAVAQTRLADHLAMIWLTPAMDGLWTDAAAGRRRFLDRIAMGFEPGHAETSIDYEKAMRERNRLLKEGGADPAWLDALERRMAEAGAAIMRARAGALARLAAASEGIGPAFPRAVLTLEGVAEARLARGLAEGGAPQALVAEEAATLARALAAGRRADAAAGRALTGPHRADLAAVYAAKRMPAAACSTGEQKALLISVCLANARALCRATGAAPVLLLDEVAAHLDPDRRQALFDDLAGLGAQVWATGTVAGHLAGLADALHVRVEEEGGLSRLILA